MRPIKQILTSFVLTLLSCAAAAQEGLQDDHVSYEHGAYFSASFGGARPAGDELTWGFEIRFGKEFSDDYDIRWDLVHFNEGHPENSGHRDGFGSQVVWSFEANPRLMAELGVGAALTLNSVKLDGQLADTKEGALLTTAALRYRLGQNGNHIRIQVSRVTERTSHSTSLFLIGFGKKFPDIADEPSASPGPGETTFNFLFGNTTTNSGGTEPATNVGLEVQRRVARHFAVAAVFIDQGDDQVRSDRKSLGSQVLRLVPLNANWTMSAGGGLLLGDNSRSTSDDLELSGLFVLRGERRLGESGRRRLYLDFSRQFSKSDLAPDGDLFRMGIGQRLGAN